MGLREKLHKSPRISVAIGIGLFAVSVGMVVWLLMSGDRTAPGEIQTKGWYTTDDGVTWFADDINKKSPYQTADGKTAVKVVVFKCGHGKTFVAYLERQTPRPKDDGKAKGKEGNPYADYFSVYRGGVQVKAPKTGSWVSVNEPAALKIMTPVCPEGSQENIEPVLP